jgi:RHS repeat-associated protein
MKRIAALALFLSGTVCVYALIYVTSLTVPVGGTTTFTVQTGCPSTVTLTPGSPIITITPQTPTSPILYPFLIRGTTPGATTMSVSAISTATGCVNPPGPGPVAVTVTGGAAAFPDAWGGNIFTFGAQDPVSIATGELFGHDDTADLFVRGPFSLILRRYYSSYLTGNGIRSGLGTNWMHNFDLSLTLTSATAQVKLFRGDTVNFTRAGNVFTLTGRERMNYQLIATGSDFRFYSPPSNLIYTFNANGALTRIEDRNGNALTVTQGANGPTLVADGLGRTLTFTYTGARLTRVQDQSGRAVSYDYAGELLSNFTDADGKRSTYSYTAAGNITGLMTNERRPAGNTPFANEYDAQGRVARQFDSRGNAMTMTYNVTPGTTGVGRPMNVNYTVGFDAQRNTTRLTDGNGQSANYTYDASDRPTALVDRLGNRSTATYDAASGRPTSYTDEEGATTTYTYASSTRDGFTFHDLTSVQNPDGTIIRIARDERGNIVSVTDETSRVWRVARNSRGQVETLTTPAGGATAFTYANDGTLTSVRGDAGDISTLAYDNARRPTTITLPDNNTVRYQYDGRDNVTRATDERGNTRVLTIDDNNRPLRYSDSLGATFAANYDNDDRVASALDANGRADLYTYDALGRLATATNAAGDRTTVAYDNLNRPATVADAAGRADTLTWDRENRLLSVTDPLARVTRFTRDRRGLVTRVTTPNNENYDFGYDSRGRQTLGTNPLGETTRYRYDARGMLAGVTRAGGVSASIERNEIGLITRITDPNGQSWQRNFDRLGRMTSSTDPLGRILNYEYDSRQRLRQSIFPADPSPQNVQLTYDAAGNLTRQLYTDGTDITYSYDAENRLLGSAGLVLGYDRNGDLNASDGLTIERDAARRITAITYASGKVLRYTYDNRGLVTRVTDWVGGFTEIAYNDSYQAVSIQYPNGWRREFTHDRNGRLATIRLVRAQSAAPVGEIVLRRDADGKVVSADRTGRYIPDPANGYLPLGYDGAHQSAASTYDALGRVTVDGPRTYEWDLASRLKSYSGPDGSATFAYDGLGQRIGRTSGGVSQSYAWNYATPLPTVATVRLGAADLRYFVWLPDGRLLYSVEATGNARRFYHFDETGSTILITDDAAAVIDAVATTPYGETVQRTGTFDNPFTWQGELGVMQEGSTGLFYMRARWYDSASARFLSKEPVSSLDPRRMSPYQFALANPMRYSDPSGLQVVPPSLSCFANAGAPPSVRAEGLTELAGDVLINCFGGLPANLTEGGLSYHSLPAPVRLLDAQPATGRLNFGTGSPDVLNTTPLLDMTTFNTGIGNNFTPPFAANTRLIPRFVNVPASAKAYNLNVGLTNLLFPFVTNQAGFDTGLAISNTSQDPFGTRSQTGACRINFYGQTTGGGAAPQPIQGSPLYALSSSGSGPRATSGFQGYIIAQCDFQYAHGFAFISDLGARRLAEGYLALVLDDGVSGSSASSAEQVGN